MGGELVSSSKISLCSAQDIVTNFFVAESDDNRVGVEDDEPDKEGKNKKDETGRVGENSCENGKIGYANEQEGEQMRAMDKAESHREKLRGNGWETERSDASKRSKLGGRWSKMGDKFEEKESRDRRSRSESDLLSDLSRSASYHCEARHTQNIYLDS